MVKKGNIIDNEEFYNYNKNDGVPKIAAINLNFDHTEFVILSASENSLGQVKTILCVFLKWIMRFRIN